MKRMLLFGAFISLTLTGWSGRLNAQEKGELVYDTFSGTLLADQQTVTSTYAGHLELHIQHRFGTMQNGLKDLIGIYAPSNIRLALNYGITDRLMVGFGSEKNNKLQDIYVKYGILQQRETGMPVSVSYFADMAVDARNAEVFGENYHFTNRFSYFHQLIIARKFGERVSVEVAPSYMHFNAVDSVWRNDYLGISANARVKLFGELSLIAEYSKGGSIKSRMLYMNKTEPNLALGFEIATPTHSFQLYAGNYRELVQQKNLANNLNNFAKGEYMVGMNVLVRF